jgi:tRNA pseudouridine38-40 synthase
MNRYFIELSFKGTSYHGWQIQTNAPTVQFFLEKSLSQLTGKKIATTGAGRTDSGVHARFFAAHFESDHAIFQHIDDFVYKINSILPSDIVVKDLYRVKPEAHARFSALSRTYEYVIRVTRDAFDTEFSWYFPRPLDLQAMNQAAVKLTENTDFTSFSKLHTSVKTNLCHITFAEWHAKDGKLVFRVKSDRFLRNMVRAMVGTMVDVGLGKLDQTDFQSVIEAKDRNQAGFSVPPQGLYLVDITYPDHIRL